MYRKFGYTHVLDLNAVVICLVQSQHIDHSICPSLFLQGRTALMIAAITGNLTIVKQLLELGADVNTAAHGVCLRKTRMN